jgi:hypothetical protein
MYILSVGNNSSVFIGMLMFDFAGNFLEFLENGLTVC